MKKHGIMNQFLTFISLILLLLFGQQILYAQDTLPQYYMSNNLVNDCAAEFFDSDAQNGNYDNFENNVFTICVPQAISITMTFSSFCLESNILGQGENDTLWIYDGPNISSNLIGWWVGNNSPGVVVAFSGCMTLHFKSDNSVNCTGWEAFWYSDVPDPIPPIFIPVPILRCNSDTLTVFLDRNIYCDSIRAANYYVVGPNITDTTFATQAFSSNCINPTDSTTEVKVILETPLSVNCNYTLHYAYRVRDLCDSLWIFDLQINFTVDDCPIAITIINETQNDTICPGDCVDLIADVATSYCNPAALTYAWSSSPPGYANTMQDPPLVCPITTTTYQVIVIDPILLISDTATYEIVVKPKPVTQNDTTVCFNTPTFNVTAAPPGGFWSGLGIIDPILGTFDPDSAKAGVHILLYTYNGCPDTLIVTVDDIDAGQDEGACPTSPPFILTGGTPGGGTWSGGPFISGGGIFDPVIAGIGAHVITYTTPNGCSDTLTVFIDTLMLVELDSLCQSALPIDLTFSPAGGVWTGTGITNAISGTFDANDAGAGTHILTYTLQGCSDSIDVVIKPIDAGSNRTACPTQLPFFLPAPFPPGGIWSGTGIIDPINGEYDPSIGGSGNRNDTLTYTFNNCSAIKIIWVRQTKVTSDTLSFCSTDPPFELDNYSNTQRRPGGGTFTGPGIEPIFGDPYFFPDSVGPGTYQLVYEKNTCTDTLNIIVYDYSVTQPDIGACIQDDTLFLSASPPGGIWSGNGITDGINGIFNPNLFGLGTAYVVYTTADGCQDTLQISVASPIFPTFTGLNSFYCNSDSAIILTGIPAGGVFGGNGIVNDSLFNPVIAGEGTHIITYIYNGGVCAPIDSLTTTVGSPIVPILSSSQDTLCNGSGGVLISASATGGDSINGYTYMWNNNLGIRDTQMVYPTSTTTYIVTIDDGCSSPGVDSVTIVVTPQIIITFITNTDSVCYGDNGYASVQVSGITDYTISWNTNPIQYTDSLVAIGGIYIATILDNVTQCSIDQSIIIPSYNPVNALFILNPDQTDCYLLTDLINILDLSEGGITGWWDYGNGVQIPYNPPENPFYQFDSIGDYNITLHIANQGNCESEYSRTICIKLETFIFVPTSFSPNDDGLNDVFEVYGVGTEEILIHIYNRWGDEIFTTTDFSQGWDGRANNGSKIAQQDVYVWVIFTKDILGKRHRYIGIVTLVN